MYINTDGLPEEIISSQPLETYHCPIFRALKMHLPTLLSAFLISGILASPAARPDGPDEVEGHGCTLFGSSDDAQCAFYVSLVFSVLSLVACITMILYYT